MTPDKSNTTGLPVTFGQTGPSRISRRSVVQGGAGLGLAAAMAPLTPRRSMASQGVTGEVNVRIFPFGTGVEDIYAQIKSGFESENPGVTVNFDLQPWDNRYPKMLADLAAGTGPDVMFITTDVLIRFSEAEAIKAVGDVVDPAAWDGYDQDTIDEITLNGKRWFMPMDQEVPIWMTNKAMLADAGLDAENPPGTWDEMLQMGEKVKESSGGSIYGWGYAAASPTLNTTFYPFLYQAGGRPISEDGSAPTFNSPAGVEALTYIVELFDRGISSQEYLQPIDTGQDPYTQEYEAVSIHSFAAAIIQTRTLNPAIDIGLTPVISNKEAWGFGGMRSWAMSNSTQNPDAAAALLMYLSKPETMAMHSKAFGVFPVKPAVADGLYADDPLLNTLPPRFPNIFGEQKHKYGRDLMPLVVPEIQGAILGVKTPQQALDDAVEAVANLFATGG